MVERIMEWAARGSHLGGVPRKMVFIAVGGFAKAVANLMNTTTVHNADTLLRLVKSRPPAVPLLTVSNHMSTDSSSHAGWPTINPGGLDEGAQRCLYSMMSDQIQTAMERLRSLGKNYMKSRREP